MIRSPFKPIITLLKTYGIGGHARFHKRYRIKKKKKLIDKILLIRVPSSVLSCIRSTRKSCRVRNTKSPSTRYALISVNPAYSD